ncbi:energy transducer TonB [Methylophaga nitratireducenticrescens]|uniref:TonB n=1 Tax=Methylophaga nitratireducenticrescens TaxID=754476 RepID=I1XML6_METNJ|nr:energy transducer TonB [Methylophaga nitratireducenticrescens]AUZ86082.1 energy transducer TonB [Methylophaga nitratireducenticrescens]
MVETDNDQSAPKTSAPQAAEVKTKAESTTARRSGKLNEQIVQARDNWQYRLHAHLAQYKQYPSSARRKGREGSPRIAFTMSRDGTVLDVWLVQSSGTELLDRAAQQLIRQAEPLPALPDEIKEQELTLTVPINYSL